MFHSSNSDDKLTPEAIAVLRGIEEETAKLRAVELAETAPATVFEAD